MAKVLGRYHIISELGRGGMGVVYKAVDPKLERFIAIKCLSDELSEDEITVTRFLREARNVAALNHPHIAQIFLADEDEGRPYFVMEFIDGESLAERLQRDKRLMPEQALRIIKESAEALKAAHEENIVHRDIKPGNIMIDRRGRAILTDFGIASIVHPDQQPKVSKYIMGTPGYLPPEVMTGQPADHRGDIFALGAVYYEMLAGRRLVPGRDIEDTARTLLASDFPVLADLDDKIDQSTFGVLGRMLAQDPNKRYQDYDALLADLEQAPVEDPVPAPPAAVDTSDEATVVAPSTPGAAAANHGTEPPPTEAVNPSVTPPPQTAGAAPPPSAGKRGGGLGLVIGLAAGLFLLVGAAVASLAFLMPERWDQFTAMAVAPFSGDDEETSAGPDPAPTARMAQSDPSERTGSSPVESEQPVSTELGFVLADSSTTREDAPQPSADELIDQSLESEAPSAVPSFSAASARLSGPDDKPDRDRETSPASDTAQSSEPVAITPPPEFASASPSEGEPAPATAHPDPPADPAAYRAADSAADRTAQRDQAEQLRSADRAETAAVEPEPDQPLVLASIPAERAAESRAAPEPAPRPSPAPSPRPEGVLVVGIGDPVFIDPMVREIEQRLRADGHTVVERGYVSGLSGLIGGAEVDLAGLSSAATAAGARYAVVARAMPSGERQLRYYGRTDTAFIVQFETVTYDLSARQRLDASDLEQIEYTALNATRQARDSIAPQLARISARLGGSD